MSAEVASFSSINRPVLTKGRGVIYYSRENFRETRILHPNPAPRNLRALELAVKFRPSNRTYLPICGDGDKCLKRFDSHLSVRTEIAVYGPRIKSRAHVFEYTLQKPNVGTLGAPLSQRRVQPTPGAGAYYPVDVQGPSKRPRVGRGWRIIGAE